MEADKRAHYSCRSQKMSEQQFLHFFTHLPVTKGLTLKSLTHVGTFNDKK